MYYKIVEVDYIRCTGCEKCVQICHKDCFEMTEKNNKIISKFINKDKCDYCGDCIVVCNNEGNAIALRSIDHNHEGYVKEIDKDKCEACGKCINLCPDKNIEITEENGKIFAKIIDPNKCSGDGHCSICCIPGAKIYTQKK